MIRNFLSDVDDWLIDSVFQPICDWMRKTFGWSKKIPTAICYLASVAGCVPMISFLIRSGSVAVTVPVFIVCLFGIYLAYCLIVDEIHDNKSFGSLLLEGQRITAKRSRMFAIPLCFLFVIPWLILFLILGLGIVAALLFGLLTACCKHYFEACTDRPKPKKFFAKVASQS